MQQRTGFRSSQQRRNRIGPAAEPAAQFVQPAVLGAFRGVGRGEAVHPPVRQRDKAESLPPPPQFRCRTVQSAPTELTEIPGRSAPSGTAARKMASRSARWIIAVRPKRRSRSAVPARDSHRPPESRMPTSPCSAARPRTASPTPSASSARSAFGHKLSPAPT